MEWGKRRMLLKPTRTLMKHLLLREMRSQLLRKGLKMQRKRSKKVKKVERGKVEKKKRCLEMEQLEMRSWASAMRIRVGLSLLSGWHQPLPSSHPILLAVKSQSALLTHLPHLETPTRAS